MTRSFGFGIVAVLTVLLLSVRAQTDAEYAKALTTVYAVGKTAEFFKRWCDDRAPASSANNARLLEAWRVKHRMPAVERALFDLLSDAQETSLKTNVASLQERLNSQLDSSIKDPVKECGNYSNYLETSFNPRTAYPNEMQVLDARLPANGSTVNANPNPVQPNTVQPKPSSAQSGVVYTVAQIVAVFEGAYRKAPGKGSDQHKAGEAAVKALGSRIYVTGTLEEDGRWLEFQNAKFESKRSVNCKNFRTENEDFPGKRSGMGGKPFTIVGTFDEYDVFFYFKDCEIVSSVAGLKPSSLDATLGLVRKKLPPETFEVKPGAGLKDSQIHGMYLNEYWGTGVGGALYLQYEPWLFLKDGTVFNDPYLAPNSFNAALSKKEEPQKWGTWTRQGDKFVIRWNDDKDGKPDTETLTQSNPGSSDQKLNGYFERLTGGGNTAYGGNTIIAAYSGYTFNPDGTFSFDSGAGASTGNDYTGNAPNVATSSQNATKKGTYKISGYNLELKFPDGKVSRRSFSMAGGKKDPTGLIYIGGSHYLKK
jgi:hypothetical protein